MPRSISIDEAKRMLRSRAELRDRGMTERDIADALVSVIAVHRDSSYAGPPFCFESAAVIHGLPLYRSSLALVHTVVGETSHSRTRAGVARHASHMNSDDVTIVQGLPCTSVERTVLDLARRLRPEGAVASADAALPRVAVQDQVQDEEIADEWRFTLLDRAAGMSIAASGRRAA